MGVLWSSPLRSGLGINHEEPTKPSWNGCIGSTWSSSLREKWKQNIGNPCTRIVGKWDSYIQQEGGYKEITWFWELILRVWI